MLQSSRRIDLLISDIGLPGMNGWQIAEIARQCRPALPVLFMTGHAQNTALHPAGIASGMGMISKPFSMDEMAAKIRDMLSRQGPTGPLAAP
jgi:DNA-binding response OmpR family regulator